MAFRRTFSAIAGLLCFAVQMLAAEREGKFEGTVKATLTRVGIPPTELLFTRKDDQLRIDAAATNKPEPINILDLTSGKLNLVFPHNSTFAQVAPTKTPAPPGKTAGPSSPPPAPSRP